MVCPLAAEGALDDRCLESPDRRIELLKGERALSDKLVEDLVGDRGERRVSGVKLCRVRRVASPHAMPHTRNFGYRRDSDRATARGSLRLPARRSWKHRTISST